MTGFGRGRYENEGRSYTVDIKSVNHKYTDISVRLHRFLNSEEDKIRKRISSAISRGKVDVLISFENYSSKGTNIRINKELAKEYIKELKSLADETDLQFNVDVIDISKFPEILKIEDEQETEIETTTQLPQLINKGEFTTDGREESDTKQPTSEQQTSNLSEGIVYQDENVIIKYAGLSIEKYNRGYVINFLIENLSSKTLTIQLRETSINGYMASPIMSIEIAPNKKAMDGAKIVNEEAEKFPMDNIKNIETKFHIFNSNDWEDYYETENIVVFDKD